MSFIDYYANAIIWIRFWNAIKVHHIFCNQLTWLRIVCRRSRQQEPRKSITAQRNHKILTSSFGILSKVKNNNNNNTPNQFTAFIFTNHNYMCLHACIVLFVFIFIVFILLFCIMCSFHLCSSWFQVDFYFSIGTFLFFKCFALDPVTLFGVHTTRLCFLVRFGVIRTLGFMTTKRTWEKKKKTLLLRCVRIKYLCCSDYKWFSREFLKHATWHSHLQYTSQHIYNRLNVQHKRIRYKCISKYARQNQFQ